VAAHKHRFEPGDIYAGRRKGNINGLGNLGSLITASAELITAQLTGRAPDLSKVGSPGDVMIGAERIAGFMNALCDSDRAAIEIQRHRETKRRTKAVTAGVAGGDPR
jgi:hypothetical protein